MFNARIEYFSSDGILLCWQNCNFASYSAAKNWAMENGKRAVAEKVEDCASYKFKITGLIEYIEVEK